jgi:hypothetical protein
MQKIYFVLLILFFLISIYAHPPIEPESFDYFHFDTDAYRTADHNFDMQYYQIILAIDHDTEYLEGTVNAEVLAEEDLTSIAYDLIMAYEVEEVLVNGSSTEFTHEDDIITIDLGLIEEGELFQTSVTYAGHPELSSGTYVLGMFFNPNAIYTLSVPYAGRYWWPSYDYPHDKAIVDFEITIRDDWLVACNGIRTDIIDNGDGTKTHIWEGENPIATYLVSLTAANYEEFFQDFEGIPIHNFVSPAQHNNALVDFENVPLMMQIFSDRYGFYPFEKYGHAVTSITTFLAMEHQTISTLSSSLITGTQSGEYVIAHELAHQWFGNCVTPYSWTDVWLSESFATYSEAVYAEAKEGYEYMTDYVKTSFHNQYISWSNSAGPRTIYDPPFHEYFAPYVYTKGASVLHMLRLEVGEENFWNILQTYFDTYYNDNAETGDFIDICEQVSGMELQQFFEQWIFSDGLPSLEYTFFTNNSSDNPELITAIKTTSNSETDFYMKLPVKMISEGLTDSASVIAEPDIPALTTIQLSASEFEAFEIDPDNWTIKRMISYHEPAIELAYQLDGSVILQWEDFWEELEIDGYNLYRSVKGENEFSKVNQYPIAATFYHDHDVENEVVYQYYITAVINDEFETEPSEHYEAGPLQFPMDQGVLVINETRDGTPSQTEIDQFYDEVIDLPYLLHHYQTEGSPSLAKMAQYSTIFWHDDDMSQNLIASDDNLNKISSYLRSGGNMIISGWRTAFTLTEQFRNEYLNITEMEMVTNMVFQSAYSPEYPDLTLDLEKLEPNFNETLPYVVTFSESDNGIYQFHGTEGNQWEGKDCAIKASEYGQVFLFGFPLYYFDKEQVGELFAQMFEELGETEPTPPPPPTEQLDVIVYPNPFKMEIHETITFSYVVENDPDIVKVELYDIRGRLVEKIRFDEIAPHKSERIESIWQVPTEKFYSGIYLYYLKRGDKSETGKIIIFR